LFIPDPDVLPIPDPGSRGLKGTESRIRNTNWIRLRTKMERRSLSNKSTDTGHLQGNTLEDVGLLGGEEAGLRFHVPEDSLPAPEHLALRRQEPLHLRHTRLQADHLNY